MSLELRSLLPNPNSCLGMNPHQQGRGTKMTMLSFCGIDVSKDRLDVMVLPGQQSFAVRNDAAGWAELIARLRGFAIAAIGLEASGGYERGAMRALLAAGLPACQVNPFKLRQFARASGVLAKNDPLDTRMIASFVAIMPTRQAQPHPPAIERLAEMLAVRRQLNVEKVAAENAARLLEDAMLQRLSRRRITTCGRYIHARPPHSPVLSKRCRARPSLPAAHIHAGSRTGVGLHADRVAARARHYEPPTSRCAGRGRT